MSEKQCEIRLGQSSEAIIPLFTGTKTMRRLYENKLIVAEDTVKQALVALLGNSRSYHRTIAGENGMGENPLLGGSDVCLVDKGEGQELILCGASKGYGTVPLAVAEEVGRQLKEILLTREHARPIVVYVRNLISTQLTNPRFSELGF